MGHLVEDKMLQEAGLVLANVSLRTTLLVLEEKEFFNHTTAHSCQ